MNNLLLEQRKEGRLVLEGPEMAAREGKEQVRATLLP
jgi:hypothetical protein